MKQISLCLIVKNEEDVIERCLNSVKDVVDEIVVVDTGSSDSTIEKVKKYTNKIYNFRWNDNFAAARNYSFSKATKDYIFWMDADDVLIKESVKEFLDLKNSLTDDVDFVSMNYVLSVDDNNNPQYMLKRNRLVKKSRGFKWIGRVHEFLEVGGNGIYSNISIRHLKAKSYTNRNLLIYEDMINKKEKLSVRDTYYYANELKDNELYKEAIKVYKNFVNMDEAWIEDVKMSYEKMAECYSILNDKKKEIESLLSALKYDVPSPSLSCKLGKYFLEEDNIKTAIFWFLQAINYKEEGENRSFINRADSTWIPALELCVCYYKLQDYKKSWYYNEMAAKFVPEHSSVVYNKKLFESMGIIE